MERKRELWVDYIKVFACILVVLGHFFQSMTKADILPANDLYQWFNKTIYYFHVPLFFICSGYLYQKLSRVDDFESWKNNVLKKLLSLGIPYVTFSTATWVLKTVFSSSVNDEIGGIVDTLLFHPTAPYWYLYCLFLIFMLTPTINSVKSAIMIILLATVGKVLILSGEGTNIYAVYIVLSNEIWFVAGMFLWLLRKKWENVKTFIGVVAIAGFIVGSVLSYIYHISSGTINFVLGAVACIGFVLLFKAIAIRESIIMKILVKYTMPIFLMHTIFAAPLRTILLKIGIQNCIIHVIVGLSVSFIGPIVATEIIKRFNWMEFFLYPLKYVKLR